MLKEGIPKVFGMSFVNNDFNDEIETISEICLQEFVDFYMEANQKKLIKIFEDSLFSL